MNATIRSNEKHSFTTGPQGWASKTAIAAVLGLGLLVTGCGGGGQGDEPQAAELAAAGEKVAPEEAVPFDEPMNDDPSVATTQAPGDASQATVEAAALATPTGEAATEEAAPQPAALLNPGRAPLGVNLEGLWDWSRLHPFVDLMKASRPWGTVDAPWDEAAPVNSRGWPMGDAAVVVNVRTFEPGDEGKPYRYITPGVYKLQFLGRATVSPSASTNVTIRNSRYDSASNTSFADVVVGTNATQLMLAFRNTNGGVRNVSLRMPGYSATATFNNQFKQALAPFQVVRFMDFLRTNNNPSRRWTERTLPNSGSQASSKGAAYEYAIKLANQLGKDIWINVPVHADENYMRSLANLLKLNLGTGRAVYVEYSNELWNFQFQQSTDNMNAAVAEAIAGDRTLTNGQACTRAMFEAGTGECNSYWAGYHRVGKKTWRMAQIFKEVFGAAAMNNQVRIVYATQFANPGIAEQVLKNIATYRGVPSSLLYGVATAPYFYLSEQLAASPSATSTQILASLDHSLRTENEPFFAAGVKVNGTFVRRAYTGGSYTGASHKALADYYRLKSLAYEGGPDLRQNPANPRAKIAANRTAAMGAMVQREISQWFGCGNDVFMHFSLSSAWDRYGYWGLTNDPTNLESPKYKAARLVAERPKTNYTTCR
jgi:hypothetical protein